MARLLDRAAPRTRRERRRRSTTTPAAVAAFGALTVGGVGLALGLTPTGARTALPSLDPLPSEGNPASPMMPGSPRTTSGELLDPAEDPALADASLGTRAGDVGPRAGDVGTRAGRSPARGATTAAPRAGAARPGPPGTTTRSTTTTTPRPTTRDAPEDHTTSAGDAGAEDPSTSRGGAEETGRNEALPATGVSRGSTRGQWSADSAG